MLKPLFSFLLFFSLFSPGLILQGQEAPVQISVDSIVSGRNNTMLDLMVTVHNTSATERNLTLLINGDSGLRIINDSRSLSLDAGEKAFLPVKIFIGKDQPAGKSLIRYTVLEGNTPVARSETLLTMDVRRELRLGAVEPQVMIFREGDSLKLSAQIFNNGNTTEETQLIAQFPNIYGRAITLNRKVTMEPFSSQTVTFSTVVDRELLNIEVFTVNIAGLNRSREFFGNTMVTVQNASSNRKYIDPSQVSSLLNRISPNRLRLSTRNTIEGSEATYLADGHTEFYLKNLEGTLSFNAVYRPEQFEPLYLSNTWLDLKNGNTAVRLGNLNTSGLERNLYGRGISFTETNDEAKPRISVGAMDKSYNLAEPLQNNRGYSAFGTTAFQMGEKSQAEQMVVFDRESDQQHFIFMNTYRYRNEQKTSLDIKLGYGSSSAFNEGMQKSSLAGGLDLRTSLGNYHLNTSGFYSSGYYPGLRRGNTYFDQRISRNFTKQNVWMAFSYNRYRPEYVIPSLFGSQHSEQISIEGGTQFQFTKKLSLNMSPKWKKEMANTFLPGSTALHPLTFNSQLLNTTLSYAPQKSHFIQFSFQQGFSEFAGITPLAYIHRSQVNWNIGKFSVNGTYQKGNFMLYEGQFGGELSRNTEKLSAQASYQSEFLNQRLSLQLNSMFSYDLYSGTNLGGMMNAEYKLGRKTLLQASFNHMRYSGQYYKGAYSFYQLGVQQLLPELGEKGSPDSGTLQVFLYRDLNNNRVYDPLIDEPASGIRISINNARFITDEKGYVQYRKVPYGSYRIRPEDSQWFAAQTVAEINQKNQLITIPLEKAGLVRGKFQYESTGIHQFDVFAYYSGIPLIFQDAFGTRYTFYANEKGEFHGYLPVGRYDVETNAAALQKNVYAAPQRLTIEVKADETNLLETIMLKVREKKVEIRKFGE